MNIKELGEDLQLAGRESAAVLRLEPFREVLDKIRTLIGALFSFLLFLGDALTDGPIHPHAAEVHTAHCVAAAFLGMLQTSRQRALHRGDAGQAETNLPRYGCPCPDKRHLVMC